MTYSHQTHQEVRERKRTDDHLPIVMSPLPPPTPAPSDFTEERRILRQVDRILHAVEKRGDASSFTPIPWSNIWSSRDFTTEQEKSHSHLVLDCTNEILQDLLVKVCVCVCVCVCVFLNVEVGDAAS